MKNDTTSENPIPHFAKIFCDAVWKELKRMYETHGAGHNVSVNVFYVCLCVCVCGGGWGGGGGGGVWGGGGGVGGGVLGAMIRISLHIFHFDI